MMSPRSLFASGTRARALAGVMVLGASVAMARVASADDDDPAATTARTQYNAGTKAFSDGRYAEAALAFEAAADAKPSPIALFTAALSWDKTNAPDRAADDYARALALPGLPPDKAAQAKDRLAGLEAMLGAVTVTGADSARVQLDANSERPVPATLHGAAGVHTLTVRAAGGAIERRPVVLERGKTTSLDLATAAAPGTDAHPAPPPAPAPAPAPGASSGPDWKTVGGVAAIGVGGGLLLAGVVLGLEAENAKNAYGAAPAQATFDHASQLQTWTNVAFIAGGVLAAGGVALVLWPSHKGGEQPRATGLLLPGGAAIQGAF
jgi:hypothetical protein